MGGGGGSACAPVRRWGRLTILWFSISPLAAPAFASWIGPPPAMTTLHARPKPHVIHHREVLRSAEAAVATTRSQSPTSSSSAPVVGGVWSELGPKPIAAPSSPEGEVAGRVTSLAVDPTNAAVVYAGTADGGVWKTTNGTSSSPTWTPLTDTQATLAIGALAIDPNNTGTIYAGTGEPNKCQDCLPGQGVLKSTDEIGRASCRERV